MKVRKTTGNLTTSGTQSISYPSGVGDCVALELHVFTNKDLTRLGNSCGSVVAFHDGTNTVSAFSFYAGNASTQQEAQRGASSTRIYMQDGTPSTLINMTISIDTANGEIDLDNTGGTAPADTYEYLLITYHGTDVNALAVRHNGADQTESLGFDWTFLRSAGPSTSSDSTTNGANNIGACDTSASQACIRHGQQDGGTNFFAHLTNNSINQNIFLGNTFEELKVTTITTNGFNLDCTQDVGGTSNEEGIYLAIGCDNSAEVLTNQTVSATGTTALTTTIEPEFVFMAGAVDMAAINTTYNGASGANFWMGCADLSGGVGASGDYFGYRFCFNRDGGVATECEISHTYCVFGVDADTSGGATIEEAEGDISAVTGTSLTLDMDLCDSTARFWVLVIGPEPGGAAKALAGVVSAGATTVGNLTGPKALAGVVQAAANTIAELGRETYLNGVAQAAASTVGGLGRETYLAGVVQGVATVLADTLAASGQIEGVIEAAATVFGDLTRQAPLEALSTGQATTVGSLTAERPLAGTATGMASTVGSLTKGRLLEGISTGQASTVGSLGRTAPLEGVSTGQASVAGVITREINLSPAPVQAGATVIGALTQTTPEDTARTDDSYEVMSKLQGPQRWGPQNPPRVYTFFEEYKLKGTEGAGTVIRLVVLPPHAQVVNLALSHDNLGTHLLQIGNQDDEDCYAANQDVSSGGVIVPSTYAVAARPMREAQIIQVKFTGSGAINPGGIIRIHGVSVQPTHRIRGEQEHT